MGTWGVKTFENDGAADWLLDLNEAVDAEFLLKPVRAVRKARGKADLDDALETLAAAELIAAARREPLKGIPSEAAKWIRRVGYSPDDATVRLAAKAVEKVGKNSELVDFWVEGGKLKQWQGAVSALSVKLAGALKLPAPIRKAKARAQRPTLAELFVKAAQGRDASRQMELQAKLRALPNPNRPVGGKGLNSMSPLHWAASEGLLEEARILIAKGAEVDIQLSFLGRPIGFAVEEGRVEMVKLLLDSGADPGYALHCAARDNRTKLVELIHARGASLTEKDEMGRTVVHFAALGGAGKSLQALAKLGADMGEKDINGETPLHYAAMFGKLAAVKSLLRLGVPVNRKNAEGKTPLDFAVEDGSAAIARILRKHGASARGK